MSTIVKKDEVSKTEDEKDDVIKAGEAIDVSKQFGFRHFGALQLGAKFSRDDVDWPRARFSSGHSLLAVSNRSGCAFWISPSGESLEDLHLTHR